MAYLLKHKDINVALLVINEEGNLVSVKEVFLPEHLPLSCVMEDGKINSRRLTQWWDERGIPSSRALFRMVMTELGATSKNRLLLESNALSLTDHYWVTKENDSKTWKDANFYENEFDHSIGALFFNRKRHDRKYDRYTPDISSDGNLRKRWDIEKDGSRTLVKAGQSPYMQEPVNEVIATLLCERLGIPHVKYSLEWEDGEPVTLNCFNASEKPFFFIRRIQTQGSAGVHYVVRIEVLFKRLKYAELVFPDRAFEPWPEHFADSVVVAH